MRGISKDSMVGRKLKKLPDQTQATPEEMIASGAVLTGSSAYLTHVYNGMLRDSKDSLNLTKSVMNAHKASAAMQMDEARKQEMQGNIASYYGRPRQKFSPRELGRAVGEPDPNAGTSVVKRAANPTNTPNIHNIRYADSVLNTMTAEEQKKFAEQAEHFYRKADANADDAASSVRRAQELKKTLRGDRLMHGALHAGRAVSVGYVGLGVAAMGTGFYMRQRNGKIEKVRMPKRTRTGK